MSITGWYCVKTIKTFTEDRTMAEVTPDEYIAMITKRYEGAPELQRELMQAKMTAFAKILISEDGMIKTYSPVPDGIDEAQKAEAIKAGYEFTEDGYFRPNPKEGKAWKEENGEFLYDSGIQGQVMGENQSSWKSLEFDGSTVKMSEGLVTYEKV